MKVRRKAEEVGSGAAVPEEDYSRASLRLLLGYLALTSIPLVLGGLSTGSWWPPALHSAAAAVVLTALRPAAPQGVRAWTPLALGPYLYVELRWIIEGVGAQHGDSRVAGWDSLLGGPWHLGASPADPLLLSELLHASYLSYYALIYVPPALLWLRGRRAAFAETTLALMVVYGICFVSYAAFPVDGPRYLLGPATAPDGPVRAIAVRLLEAGSSRGTAFPSAHVAASVVASWYALRFHRALGSLVLALTGGLAIGAVYGGYHYAIDIVAGLVVGLVALALVRTALRLTGGAPAVPR